MLMMLLLSSAECHDPWFPYSSNLPHTHCICPAWNEAHILPFQKNLLRGDPPSPHFFFHRGDNRTMTWPRLVMHHCLRSISILQVHHLTLNICSRKPFFFQECSPFSHQHLVVWNSRPVTFLHTRQMLDL